MWMAIVLMAWGVWCLLRAPGLAAQRRRSGHSVDSEPLCSPMEWRAMGVLWLLLGLGVLLYPNAP